MPGASTRSCPALFIAAPASGQGKTTATAALARLHQRQGRRVRVFKTGADFLDPMILSTASGSPCYQLDLFMGGPGHCQQLLYDAAAEADLILIEGVMGLFDGTPSSADLAELFGVPVLAVVDASAMAQTFAAIVHGLASFRSTLPFAGVLANGVAGAYHQSLLTGGLSGHTPLLGSLPHDPAFALPERQLGTIPPAERADLEQRLDAAATALENTPLAMLPKAVAFESHTPDPLKISLRGVRIGIAQDEAFCFAYPANLDLLQRLGAELIAFSPLHDHGLPTVDSLYLPGGQPELHAQKLSDNRPMLRALQAHHAAGRPLLAEGGGLLYLLEALNCATGRYPLTGLLPGEATLGSQLRALGPQQVTLPEGELRGNTFHYATVDSQATVIATARCPNQGPSAEPIYRSGRLTASSMQFYFPSNPTATASLLKP